MLNPDQIQSASIAVRELRVSLSNFFLYSSENAMVTQSLERLLEVLGRLFETLPAVAVGESEGRLVVEGSPLDERLAGSTNMLKDLFLTHKIHSLTFLKGLAADEMRSLFSLLKPKALPSGMSLAQALVQQSLEHIRVNEKVFVALSEGEVVVKADSGAPGEQNLQEALEALQYFLQIFSRVKPDHNKQEVARRLMENMGAWVGGEGMAGVAGERKGTDDARPWRELLGGFLALKGALASIRKPAELKEAQVSMDELLKKLVLLGESQGVSLEEAPKEGWAVSGEGPLPPGETPSPANPGGASGEGTPATAPEALEAPEQENLFETDPVLSAVESGAWGLLEDPLLEEKVAQRLPQLQELERAEVFESLWEKLWEMVFSPEEEPQALALRQLNRIQWNRLSRPLQLEGFRNLRRLLEEIRRPALYPFALTLVQDWIPQELSSPDWEELLGTVRLLKELAEKTPPLFEKQNQATRVALETVFCEPVLESLFGRFRDRGRDADGIRRLFLELGVRVAPFFFNKVEREAVESPDWKDAVEMLEEFEVRGLRVYESWLDWPEKRTEIEKFLEIFKATPPKAEMEDYFRRHWGSFGPAAQVKILEIIEQWKRTDFRPFLADLLERPDQPVALRALEALSRMGREGDGETVVEAVKRYPPRGKDREKFWVQACRALGALSDAAAASALMEWAEKYKFMEHKRERSLEVRRAALEALGGFRSQTVRDFLATLQRSEKELRPEVERALQSVEEKLSTGGG